MADDSTTTILATFQTREAVDRAVEHLVQQHGRTSLFNPSLVEIPPAQCHRAATLPMKTAHAKTQHSEATSRSQWIWYSDRRGATQSW
jgi:hypothetical protein